MDQLKLLWEQQRWRVLVGLVGVVMVGVGGWQMAVQSRGNEVVVETPNTSDQKPDEAGEIVVDVGGAVTNPGLYRLPVGIRVGEVLTEAGGITDTADGEWVGKMINLAEVAKDGQKIYVPAFDEVNSEQLTVNSQGGNVSGASIINVNTATESDLDALWGIGAARAKAIIQNRPYATIEELKDKAGIPANVMEANERKWGVY